MHSVYRCHANSHSYEWFSFHSGLVVPVFLISVQYQMPGGVRHTILSLSALHTTLSFYIQEHSQTVLDHMASRDPHTPGDDVILDMAPPLPVQPKLALLDEASILRVANCTSLSEVEV